MLDQEKTDWKMSISMAKNITYPKILWTKILSSLARMPFALVVSILYPILRTSLIN
ncbi:hypothetical protein D9M72_296310 [compost metagenome]